MGCAAGTLLDAIALTRLLKLFSQRFAHLVFNCSSLHFTAILCHDLMFSNICCRMGSTVVGSFVINAPLRFRMYLISGRDFVYRCAMSVLIC
jgi:hypothetical protein